MGKGATCDVVSSDGEICGKKAMWGYDQPEACSKHRENDMKVVRQLYCDTCGSTASYGWDNGPRTKCKKHILPRMIRRDNKHVCQCPKQVLASYGYPDDARPSCCKSCKLPEMISLGRKSDKCICVKGAKRPTFGYPEDKRPSCCKTCRQPGMIDLLNGNKKCGCPKNVIAVFGLSEHEIKFCNSCKPPGAINIRDRNRRCQCPNVTDRKRPTFGYAGNLPICCTRCKVEGMIDVNSILCHCGKKALFGTTGSGVKYCFTHKEPGMTNLRIKKCVCGEKPAMYGYLGGKYTHCKKCKKDGMILLRAKRCECNRHIALFGYPLEGRRTCCSECKKEGMINLSARTCPCERKVTPSFRYPGKQATHCYKCFLPGMESTHKKCPCGNAMVFAYEKQKPEACSKCKKDGMINTCTRPCLANEEPYNILCACFVNKSNKKYDGFCSNCFVHLFPTDPRSSSAYKKNKETQVVVHLSQKYPELVHDKPLLYGDCPCPQKRRIDLRMIIEGTLLCIEIDENQHRNYNQEEEIVRYNDLMAYHTGRMIFIRYNPDGYRNEVDIIQNPSFEDRMKRLLQEIEHQIERIKSGANVRDDKLIEVVYLFYNANKPQSLKDLEDDILFHEDAENEEEKEGVYQPSVISTSSPTDDEDCIYIPVDQELIRRYTQSPQNEAVIVLED